MGYYSPGLGRRRGISWVFSRQDGEILHSRKNVETQGFIKHLKSSH